MGGSVGCNREGVGAVKRLKQEKVRSTKRAHKKEGGRDGREEDGRAGVSE
jgi:hypothetical protein